MALSPEQNLEVRWTLKGQPKLILDVKLLVVPSLPLLQGSFKVVSKLEEILLTDGTRRVKGELNDYLVLCLGGGGASNASGVLIQPFSSGDKEFLLNLFAFGI